MFGSKTLSASVLWLQAVAFALATIYLMWAFNKMIVAGGGFVPGFESIMLRRLIASLAPYLVLPVSIIVSLLLYKRRNYAISVVFPLALLSSALIAGRIYLESVPDPIVENFGARAAPYEGFFVLPPDAVPPGFKETAHHYTKQEYSVRFAKMLNDERIDLDIVESPTVQFLYDRSNIIRQFTHQGISGDVYSSHNSRTAKTTLTALWLNPPRQRLAISLTQTRGNDYSPDDVIQILESMKPAERQR